VEPDASDRRPWRAVLVLGVALIVLLALTSFALLPRGGSEAGPDSFTVGGHPLFGQPAPEIDLATFDGERMTLSSLRGRPVLVNFWATWCSPCRAEFPLMVQAYAEHADEGLVILGILSDDLVENGRRFAADQGATWPMLYDADDEAWTAYMGLGKPTSFFIDPDGIVRAFSLGPFSEEGLERQLATILPAGTAGADATSGTDNALDPGTTP
jgi:cytochrome c biogenesis protein CcmG, thiol:disulfide interchange protein DsbE